MDSHAHLLRCSLEWTNPTQVLFENVLLSDTLYTDWNKEMMIFSHNIFPLCLFPTSWLESF